MCCRRKTKADVTTVKEEVKKPDVTIKENEVKKPDIPAEEEEMQKKSPYFPHVQHEQAKVEDNECIEMIPLPATKDRRGRYSCLHCLVRNSSIAK